MDLANLGVGSNFFEKSGGRGGGRGQILGRGSSPPLGILKWNSLYEEFHCPCTVVCGSEKFY